jgi:heterodisulfide reductase subunit B
MQGSSVRMPVLHLSQLVGLAVGLESSDVQLNKLMVSPQAALSRV